MTNSKALALPGKTNSYPRSSTPRPKRESLREDILRAIKNDILTAELEDGQVYTMTEVADRLGGSRTPVREALLELEKRGLVEIIRSVGFRVTAPTPQDLLEVFQIREWLEVPALVAIAGRVSPTAIKEGEILVADMEVAAQESDIRTFQDLDRRFHGHFVAQAGNARLTKILDEAREIQWVPGLRDSLGSKLIDRNREHRGILKAISRDRPERVRLLMFAHLEFSRLAWGLPGKSSTTAPPSVSPRSDAL